jgi:alpha-methylacyl-CoA racemase
MLLGDLGADVVRIDRRDQPAPPITDPVGRNRRSIVLDLKVASDRDIALRLMENADALFEGFRPGVMEKLGLGPEAALVLNPRLVYARMTGWGQYGPLAAAAGHDLNYIALSGALDAIGPRNGPPAPPLNLVGDLGGGSLYLVVGILAALLEARTSGRGQVIDCAICDCVATLMAPFMALRSQGLWRDGRGSNFLDGGAPYYGAYECADGRYVCIGPIEARFFDELLRRVGIDPVTFGPQNDTARWDEQRQRLAQAFRTRSRDEWCALMEGTDCCFAPVLTLTEAPSHAHLRAREVHVAPFGVLQPAPAPRFSRTQASIRRASPAADADRQSILHDWIGQLPGAALKDFGNS